MSLEEERARQAASASANAPAATAAEVATLPSISEASTSAQALPTSAPSTTVAPTSHSTDEVDADDEEALLAQALAMSHQTGEDVDMVNPSETKESGSAGAVDEPNDEEMTEEEAIAKAIAMSMQEDQDDAAKK
jgi:26S proteasome regulatory subunit N10